MTSNDLDARAINTIRALAMDLPEQARSGHQGTAMALAPLAHVLWTRIMDYDAEAPEWFDRDRFVLSAGHASVLLYSMLRRSRLRRHVAERHRGGRGAASAQPAAPLPVQGSHLRRGLPDQPGGCLLYTSPSPRDGLLSRMPSSA